MSFKILQVPQMFLTSPYLLKENETRSETIHYKFGEYSVNEAKYCYTGYILLDDNDGK